MDKNAANLGTITLPELLPRDIFSSPFELPTTLTRMYCNVCGQVNELNRDQLALALEMANLSEGIPRSVESVSWEENYILAHGCHACNPEVTAFTLQKAG